MQHLTLLLFIFVPSTPTMPVWHPEQDRERGWLYLR